MPAPLRAVIKPLGERLAGSKPSVLRSLVAAITIGVAAAVATYRLLRSGD